MARARTPIEKAEITGQAEKNKARYAPRKTSKKERKIGEPPDWMDEPQKNAWASFVNEMPWIYESHRALLEVASVLRAQFWEDPLEFGVNRINQLRMTISSMGGTPADASKVYKPDDDDEEDPTAKFFN